MDKFCKFCGVEHVAQEYPKKCEACESITWVNPIPVAVLLQPVTDGLRTGVLIGQRAIQPMRGQWGLPGGFVDPKDRSIEHAACRELLEETGATAHPEFVKLIGSFSTIKNMLVFCKSEQVLLWKNVERGFKANNECSAIDVAWEPRSLCFQSHTDYLLSYLKTIGV